MLSDSFIIILTKPSHRDKAALPSWECTFPEKWQFVVGKESLGVSTVSTCSPDPPLFLRWYTLKPGANRFRFSTRCISNVWPWPVMLRYKVFVLEEESLLTLLPWRWKCETVFPEMSDKVGWTISKSAKNKIFQNINLVNLMHRVHNFYWKLHHCSIYGKIRENLQLLLSFF